VVSIPNWEIGAGESALESYRVPAADLELPMFVLAYSADRRAVVIGTTAIVFAALAEAVTTAALADTERSGLAERINRWSRAIFPLVLAACALVAFA
jgi:hypothetical protein